jgi:hypothetical protein
LIAELSSSRKFKAPATSGAFFCVQARRGTLGDVAGRPGESGLRWGANHCNMEWF